MSYYGRDKTGFRIFLYILVILVIIVSLRLVTQLPNCITEEKAMERFIEITGTTDIEVIRHSNMNLIIGDAHDVTFELKVNGKNVSARCTSGIFSEMVCRVYSEE